MKRGLILLLGLAVAVQPPARPAPPVAPDTLAVPGAMQWLYGSGEGASTGIQAYRAFREYAVEAARHRPKSSVVLAAGATLEAPRFVPCGRKPLAVVLDVDETTLLNTGYEYDQAAGVRGFDTARWARWEQTGADKVAPIPGAVTALSAIRRAGIRVIFNSNRSAATAAYSEAALNGAGVGPARHGETLYLQGDVAPGGEKDPRRAEIASHYCVVAMAGDQFGDFTDLLNAKALSVPERRRIASGGPIARLWGNGWFMLSNPVYGPSIRGSFDAVFPADKRWIDPQGPGDMAGIDQTIRAVYAVISGPPGQKRDFDHHAQPVRPERAAAGDRAEGCARRNARGVYCQERLDPGERRLHRTGARTPGRALRQSRDRVVVLRRADRERQLPRARDQQLPASQGRRQMARRLDPVAGGVRRNSRCPKT